MTERHNYIIKQLETYVKGSDFKGRAFVFGGYLRDCLSGVVPNDIDLLLMDTQEEGFRFSEGLAKFTGDYVEGENPTRTINAIRMWIYRKTPNETRLDITPYIGEPGMTVEESLVHSCIFHRDFAVDNLLMDLATGEVSDPSNMAMKALVERSAVTANPDYEYIFWRFPIRLYRMFRLQSVLGYSIPQPQLEYAREHWWLGNFTERERIILEMERLRRGKHSDLASENLAYARLDPRDLTRAPVLLGENWYECEPGYEPIRVKKEPHARWTGKNPILFLNPTVEAVELEFTKSGYSDFKSIKFSRNDGPYEEKALDGNSVRIPTISAKKMQLEIPPFVPAKCMDTTDDRELGVYVTKINTYKMGEKTETLIDYVPTYIDV